MHENQTFKDELLGSNVEIRRPRAEQMRCPEAVPQENQNKVKVQCLKPKSLEGVELGKRRGKIVRAIRKATASAAGEVPQVSWRPIGKSRPAEKTWEHLQKMHGQTIFRVQERSTRSWAWSWVLPICGFGTASNSGGNEPGQLSGANRQQFDPDASNEDLLRAALLQVLGGNQATCIPLGLACNTVNADYWEVSEDKCWVTRHHVELREEKQEPTCHDCPIDLERLRSTRWTMIAKEKNKFQTREDN